MTDIPIHSRVSKPHLCTRTAIQTHASIWSPRADESAEACGSVWKESAEASLQRILPRALHYQCCDLQSCVLPCHMQLLRVQEVSGSTHRSTHSSCPCLLHLCGHMQGMNQEECSCNQSDAWQAHAVKRRRAGQTLQVCFSVLAREPRWPICGPGVSTQNIMVPTASWINSSLTFKVSIRHRCPGQYLGHNCSEDVPSWLNISSSQDYLERISRSLSCR